MSTRLKTISIIFAISLCSFSPSLSAQNPPPPVETPEVQPESRLLEVRFYGLIQSIGQTAVALNGQVIDTVELPHALTALVGDFVRVDAVLRDNGTLSARRIEVVPSGALPGIVMITGTIVDISPELRLINFGGLIIDYTNANTSDTELAIGDQVQVFAVQVNNRWEALAVIAINRSTSPAAASETMPGVQPPVVTPEAAPPALFPPVTTPEVFDDNGGDRPDDSDDESGQGRGRGRGGDDDSGGDDSSGDND